MKAPAAKLLKVLKPPCRQVQADLEPDIFSTDTILAGICIYTVLKISGQLLQQTGQRMAEAVLPFVPMKLQ